MCDILPVGILMSKDPPLQVPKGGLSVEHLSEVRCQHNAKTNLEKATRTVQELKADLKEAFDQETKAILDHEQAKTAVKHAEMAVEGAAYRLDTKKSILDRLERD